MTWARHVNLCRRTARAERDGFVLSVAVIQVPDAVSGLVQDFGNAFERVRRPLNAVQLLLDRQHGLVIDHRSAPRALRSSRSNRDGLYAITDLVEIADTIEAAVRRPEADAVAAVPLDDFDDKAIALIAIGEVENAGQADRDAVNEFGFAPGSGGRLIEAFLTPARGVIPFDGWIGMAKG
jgi:hypothetical protein